MEKEYEVCKKEDYLSVLKDLKTHDHENMRSIKVIINYEDEVGRGKELLFYYYLILNYYKDINFSVEVRVDGDKLVQCEKWPEQLKTDDVCKKCKERKINAVYFSIGAYAYIQYNSHIVKKKPNSSQIVFYFNNKKSQTKNFRKAELHGIQKHLPVISINEDNYQFLKSSVKQYWKDIVKYKALALNDFKNIVLYLCGNALFGDSKYIQLTRIRRLIFGSSLFENCIGENTVLALLIFALYDYHLRGDLTEKYYESIKSNDGNHKSRPNLTEADFFKEYQMQQSRQRFERYLELKKQDGDLKSFLKRKDTSEIQNTSLLTGVVKSIYEEFMKTREFNINDKSKKNFPGEATLTDYFLHRWVGEEKAGNAWENRFKECHRWFGEEEAGDVWEKRFKSQINEELNHYSLHPQIVKELYEAVIISEGLLQLIENTVYHAGNKGNNGCGVMDMRILNTEIEQDQELIAGYYAEKKMPSEYKNKYWMLINIADISMTNISKKFYENNKVIIDKICENTPEIGKILANMMLKGFFRPDKTEWEAWSKFYNYNEDSGETNDRAVNHFGLQIFDSIVRSKGGIFMAASGEDTFGKQNMLLKIPGTIYRILVPLDEKSYRDDNIFDTMLGYKIQEYVKCIGGEVVPITPYIMYQEPAGLRKKEKYISNIAEKLQLEWEKATSGKIIYFQFDFTIRYNLECLVKGVLLFIFRKNQEEEFKFAFVNCSQYHILEIIRLIALYYDRQEENRKMRNVQIYIKGKEIGEELLLYGETLTTLRDNLALSACIKGTMYQNLNVINTILSRRKPE